MSATMALIREQSTTTGQPMAAKPKLNGITVDKDVLEEANEILSVEREAFIALVGGRKTTSMSDIVSEALAMWNADWRSRHGIAAGVPVAPTEPGERRRFVLEVARRNIEALRAAYDEQNAAEKKKQ